MLRNRFINHIWFSLYPMGIYLQLNTDQELIIKYNTTAA